MYIGLISESIFQVPIYAPVTETLSTLSRDQLQKLVQYAINEDPGGVLGKVFKRISKIINASSQLIFYFHFLALDAGLQVVLR